MNPDYSPADSFLSTPDNNYQTGLFDDATTSPAAMINTPQSLKSEPGDSVSPEPEKKPTKKRKSWGQELPTPTTSLPPRKRAKTAAEKEQRRIERVLRNRAAAQSSRERKRQEVEKLEGQKMSIEQENHWLHQRLDQIQGEKDDLAEQVAQMAAQMTVFKQIMEGKTTAAPVSESQHSSPTLSADLHPDGDRSAPNVKLEIEDFELGLHPPSQTLTLNPRDASLSSSSSTPNMDPIAMTPNMTQHPAEMLCDLQCQLGVSRPQWALFTNQDQLRLSQAITFIVATHMNLLIMTSITAYSTILQPLREIFHSIQKGTPLPPSLAKTSLPILFPLIHFLISTPANLLSSTTTKSFSLTHTTPQPQPTIRINLLRRLLACSPTLARPLGDATGRALQLLSRDGLIRSRRAAAGGEGIGNERWSSLVLMSRAIESFERSLENKESEHEAGDPAGDLRRLCVMIDEAFGKCKTHTTSTVKVSREYPSSVQGMGNGGLSPPRRFETVDLVTLLSGKGV